MCSQLLLSRLQKSILRLNINNTRQLCFRSNNNRHFSVCIVNNNYLSSSDNNDNIFRRILQRTNIFDYSKTKLKVSGYILYESIVDNITYLKFFQEYKIPDTFYSWFVVTELHLWMLSVRVMAEDSDGRVVRNSMTEALWTDVQSRVKKLGAANVTDLKEQVNELSEQFHAALVGYDEGLLSNDDRILAGALWRRFFQRKCSGAQELEKLVFYVRKQVMLFDDLSKEDIFEKRAVKWSIRK